MKIPSKICGFAFRGDELDPIEKQLRDLQDDEVLIKKYSSISQSSRFGK